jgi:CRISPR/Cas system endoribonuclease Cas6 (RAMP superfamily)
MDVSFVGCKSKFRCLKCQLWSLNFEVWGLKYEDTYGKREVSSDFKLRTSHFEVRNRYFQEGRLIFKPFYVIMTYMHMLYKSCIQDWMVLQSYNSSYMNLDLKHNQCPWSMKCGSKGLTFVEKLTSSLRLKYEDTYGKREVSSDFKLRTSHFEVRNRYFQYHGCCLGGWR